MSRVAIITGAYDYPGWVIRAKLDSAGWTTVALVAAPRPGDRAITWRLGAPLPDDVEGTDALVHCEYDFEPRTRRDVWRVNVQSGVAMLRAAKQAGVRRTLVLSSMSAYAGTKQLYGQARLAIEDACLALGGVVVRPGLVYGDEPGEMAGALLQLTRLPVVPVLGGEARQFPVHEDDLANAIREIIEAPTWSPAVVGVAQPKSLSFRELLAALAEREGRTCRFVTVPWRLVFGALRLAEATGARLPLRSDSVLGLVRPARSVPQSAAFPGIPASPRVLGQPGEA